MPKQATGHVVTNSDGTFSARVRVAPGAKGKCTCPLAVTTKDDAELRTALLASMATKLRGVAATDEIVDLLTLAGTARSEKSLAKAIEAVDLIASGTTTKTGSAIAPSFEAFAKEWTSKELHKRFPDHVREKDESEDVQLLRDYINPKMGPTRLPDVTLADAELVMQGLPATLGPRTRRHVAQCIRKVLSLAVYPGRHIALNPIPREWMPKIPKSANKAKTCLFPDEDAKLAGCTAVLLERRIAYGILAREGMRASELELLRWRDVDLDRGRIRLDENKTDDPRAWALSSDVTRVLTWWKKQRTPEQSDLVLQLDLSQGPRWLRGKVWAPKTRHKNELGDLRTAGVTRAELFERTASRMPIRLHDLRGTFVTVSLANGKTEQWVSDRTGHKSSQMIALYSRQARTWEELALGAMRPLDALLPEMQAAAPDARAATPAPAPAATSTAAITAEGLADEWPMSGSDCRTRTCDPAVNRRGPEIENHGALENKPLREPETARDLPVQTVNGQSSANPGDRAHVLEAAIERLTRALVTASDEVIAELVAERRAMRAELEQLHQDAGGVVRLDDQRRRRRRE